MFTLSHLVKKLATHKRLDRDITKLRKRTKGTLFVFNFIKLLTTSCWSAFV